MATSYKEVRQSSKQKETVDLLMSIIRTLSSSSDTEQREREKAKLEKAYKQSDKNLIKLVTDNQGDLTSIIQSFSDISKRVTDSQQKVQTVKDNLQSCKNLLQCKRDELKKLWIEGLEHKIVVTMLDQITSMRDVSDRLQAHIENKHYLHATDLVVTSVTLLHNDLANVEALRDIRGELDHKKEELHNLLMDELHKQIYVRLTAPVMASFQREGSQRQSNRMMMRQRQGGGGGNSLMVNSVESKAVQLIKSIENVNLDEMSKPKMIHEDLNRDNDEDPIQFIAILIECLARLDKLPESIETLRSRIKPGLLAIVQRSSQQVSDNAYFEDEDLSTSNNPQYLLDLLDLVIRRSKIVAKVHNIILANLKRIKSSNTSKHEFIMYEPQEVWLKIQSVLQLFVSDYLDLCNTSSVDGHALSNYDADATMDMNSYFAKKRNPKAKKFALFKFDNSSHAISMNSYLREQRQEYYGPGDPATSGDQVSSVSENTSQTFVCKPCVSNITIIYKPLKKFIIEIETEAGLAPKTCMLYAIITEFIRNNYLGQVMYNIQKHIDTATKGFDAQRIVIDHRKQKELNVTKPLLQSTVTVARNVADLQALMYDLPDYAEQFIDMICKILEEYQDTCQSSYRAIVGSEADEKQIISATWSRDEDIGRFLRCLPNWQSLKGNIDDQGQTSPEDLRALNSKESMILTTNLSSPESVIPDHEVISDQANIKTLANLCESLEWLRESIHDLSHSLSMGVPPSASTKTEHIQKPAVSEGTLHTLSNLAHGFDELSELCLLVLHLEVRVHCFYHLMPLAKQSNYSGAIDDMDPDKHVLRMIKDITALQDTIQQSVQDRKFKYIFEGLAHLVSQILINSTQYLKRINENGIKKMCRNIFSLQQSLTHITTSHERESDLDHARKYYELLYRAPEDLVALVEFQGVTFTELEYKVILDLHQRSQPNAKPAVYMKAYQQLQNRINHSTTSDIQNMEADWEIPEQHKTWEDILRYPRLNDHDILNMIMDCGPQFSEHDYTQLFSLYNRSGVGKTETQLLTQLDRLKNILTDFETPA